MKIADDSTPRVLTWYCRISMLRLLFFLVCFLVLLIIHESLATLVLGLLCGPLAINDIVMLTTDFRYTHTYIGSITAQAFISVLAFIPPALLMVIYKDIIPYCTLNIVGTLYLLVTLLQVKHHASSQSPGASWISNAKDAMFGLAALEDRTQTSFAGRSRDLPLEKWSFRRFLVLYAPSVLLRRVSQVESRKFAFFQNTCALLFITTIIIRAITALSHAQTAFETRTRVEQNCGITPLAKDIQILMRHWNTTDLGSFQSRSGSTGVGYVASVQVLLPTWNTNKTDVVHCVPQLLPVTNIESEVFEVFTCDDGQAGAGNTPGSLSPQGNSATMEGNPTTAGHSPLTYSLATYNITIHSTNHTSLYDIRLPDIWLSNAADTFRRIPSNNKDNAKKMDKFAPWLVTPWKLSAGLEVQASLGLAVRKFITSSVVRDTVINLDPVYETTSLFPIETIKSTPIDDFVASAVLSASFQTAPSYLTSRGVVETDSRYSMLSDSVVCEIIEDYRSSTTFDALGSIGGLLAILQGLHVLLFGRPMFWGIAGAKLISPFGLFGSCHSRDFRRRLRERYYCQPTDIEKQEPSAKDVAETIRIGAFLRDFIIDFGPAETESVAKSDQTKSTTETVSETTTEPKVQEGGRREPII